MHQENDGWFFDESRFGTYSNIGHGWFKKGVRTPVKIRLGYENFYLYSATNSITGDIFSLILPKVNTLCMNVFLQEFNKYLNGRDVLLIMDGATWHKSKTLSVQGNIRIVIQPPYSPELNPVERLWQYIKQNVLKNKVYETLSSLEDEVCKFLAGINPQTIRSVCGYNMYN